MSTKWGMGIVVILATGIWPVVLSGCGSSSNGSSTRHNHSPTPTAGRPAQADSCTVITRSEAGSALGQTVKAPVRGHATVEGGVACVFYGPSAPAHANADVPATDSVRVVLVTGSKAKSFFDDYRGKVAAETVKGMGDEAYYDGYASLSVLRRTEYLRVAVIGVSRVLAAEKRLARDALTRM